MKLFIFLKKYFYKIALISNWGLVILLLLSYLCVFVSPAIFYPLAFFGLLYPLLFILNLLFAIFWILRKSKLFIVSTLCLLLGWNFITRFCQLNIFEKQVSTKIEKIKVLSYNVRIFDLWNWSTDKNTANKIFSFVKKSSPNIVCFQEFYSKKVTGKNAMDTLLKIETLKHCHISYTKNNGKIYNTGLATFTSYPILNMGSIKINDNDNYCIYTDLKIDNDTIRVYNIHLESIHLGKADYTLIDNIDEKDSINVPGLKAIFWKLKKGYKKRALQAKSIVENLSECKYPTILCGDFNDTPVSYTYQQLTKYLDDSFTLSGKGIGYTLINKYRTFRIDYILHSENLISSDYNVPHVKFSDHFPVQCNFELNSIKKTK